MLDALVAEARVRWGLDLGAGLQVVPTERLISTPAEPSRPLLLVPQAILRLTEAPLEPEPLPGRHGHPDASDPLGVLARLYPANHVVGRLGVADTTVVGALRDVDLAGPLYLTPVEPELALASPWALPWISSRLRRPDGCPWDREQTHESLRKHLLEEAYEVYDALEAGATPALADELGDLLLQIVLHAQLAAEAGVFDLADVESAIGSKIVRRHPHVFGEAEARTASDVSRQWEQIKKAERAAAAEAEANEAASDPAAVLDEDVLRSDAATPARPRSALDGISSSMPALAASQEMQERAANLGYDWPDVEGVLGKVHEELAEVLEADSDADRREEMGDLLLVVVNLARKYGVESEAALRAANDKFRRRFRIVERQAAQRGVALRELSFEQLDELWHQAKAEDAGRAARREEAAR